MISPQIFRIILDYIYSGKITINEENVQDVLSCADMYRIESLLSPCESFLRTQLHPSNALGILLFAESHSLNRLRADAEAFVHHNFLQVVEQEEFYSLPKESLIELLESENLRVENEFQVFSSVVSWVVHSLVVRRRFLFEVVRPVRFVLIPHRQLQAAVDALEDLSLKVALKKHLQDYKIFSGHKSPAEVLHQQHHHQNNHHHHPHHPGFASVSSKFSPHLLVPRKSAMKCVYVVAGYQRRPGQRWSDSEALRTVEQFDSYKQEWRQMAQLRYPRNGHGAASLGGFIYVIGGESDSLIYDTVEKYEVRANQWSLAASMTVPRCNHGVAASGSHVYALGGWVGSEIGSSIERFDPVANIWQVYGTMPRARYGFGIVAYQGLIYIAGGCSDAHEVLNSFDAYNPVIKEWTSLPPLRTPRCFFSLVATEDVIYALGGQSGPSEHDNALDVCERFSLTGEQQQHHQQQRQQQHHHHHHRDGVGWTTTKWKLPSARAGHSAAVVNGCVLVVGGRDDGTPTAAPTTLDHVDRFDPESETWVRLGQGMLESHCEAAAVLV